MLIGLAFVLILILLSDMPLIGILGIGLILIQYHANQTDKYQIAYICNNELVNVYREKSTGALYVGILWELSEPLSVPIDSCKEKQPN